MRNIVLTFSAMALLIGCSSKEEKLFIQTYEKEKIYHHNLQKSEKIQLYNGEFTQAMLTATYLNKKIYNKKNKAEERFIVGVYSDDSDAPFTQGGYSLTLNGKAPKSITLLTKEDSLLKDLSFVSEWSQFYLVTFAHVPAKSFKLLFKSDLYGKGVVYFAKVAKYTLSKKLTF